MEWTDQAIILSARPHGENSAILSLLTQQFGRHAGLWHGLQRNRATVELGTVVQATWRARLRDQLGQYSLEVVRPVAAWFFDDPIKLAALVSACALTDAALPEREAHVGAYHGLMALFDVLAQPQDIWAPAYVQWELGLLATLGFGLQLDQCAATGGNDCLAYVSPRTGRAVSASAGQPYAARMLPLPPFLIGGGLGTANDIINGLQLSGHFLERMVFNALHLPLPAARERLVSKLKTPQSPT